MVKRKTGRPEDIKDIVDKVISKIEKKGPGKKEKILCAWQEVVGDRAATHSRPASLRRGVLRIEVDSSTWFYQLNINKHNLLYNIQKRLKGEKIKDVRFRMGDIT